MSDRSVERISNEIPDAFDLEAYVLAKVEWEKVLEMQKRGDVGRLSGRRQFTHATPVEQIPPPPPRPAVRAHTLDEWRGPAPIEDLCPECGEVAWMSFMMRRAGPGYSYDIFHCHSCGMDSTKDTEESVSY